MSHKVVVNCTNPLRIRHDTGHSPPPQTVADPFRDLAIWPHFFERRGLRGRIGNLPPVCLFPLNARNVKAASEVASAIGELVPIYAMFKLCLFAPLPRVTM
ncbi:hypothetical protein ABQF17_21975 [Mycolicibacterium elephantis]